MAANTNSGNSGGPSKKAASYEDERTAEEEVESEKIFEKLATSSSKNCSSYPSKTNTEFSSAESNKLKASESQSFSSDDDGQEELLGPGLQEPAVPSKSSSGHASTFRARKRPRVGEPSSSLLLSELPSSGQYIRSFMHRDIVTHVLASTRTGFALSASVDGQVKFWVRDLDGKSNSLEFVKQFRAHAGPLLSFELSLDEKLLLTMGAKDRTLRIFSVESFDMLEFVRLPYVPSAAAFVSKPRAPAQEVAVAQTEGKKVKVNVIRIGEIASQAAVMDSEEKEAWSSSASLHREISLPHVAPVSIMRYNARYDAVISIDRRGLIEYWRPGRLDEDNDGEDSNIRSTRRDDIDGVKFRFKAETDLFELAKNCSAVTSVAISPDGEHFAVRARDRSIRVFKFVTGRMVYVYVPACGMEKEDGNEDGEFDARIARRLARERQLIGDMTGAGDEDDDMTGRPFGNVLFDSSGRLVLFATVLGIQVVCLKTTNVLRTLGQDEAAERFLVLALFSTSSSNVSSNAVENAGKRNGDAEINAENIASENAKSIIIKKPLLISSAYDSQRLFLFSNDSPDADSMTERDIFNERPVSRARGRLSSRVEQDVNSNNAATVAERVTLHTSAGDIMLRLYKQMSKTVLNFTTHAKNGYYNRVEFHRVIKGFMVQTGDPTGSGSGGESIWGADFEDEIDSALKHTPGTLSMANAGANTNASQFFITTADTPHLDGKHTIFGKVIKGMGVVHQIENVRVDKKDRPLTPIRIESVSVHYS